MEELLVSGENGYELPCESEAAAKLLILMPIMVFAALSHAQAQPQGGAYKIIKVDGRNAGAASSDGILAGKTLYLACQRH